MKIIDLTMPLYNGQPAGHGHWGFKGHPMWPEPFNVTDTMSYEADGRRFHVFTIFSEPGTRLILASYKNDFKDEPTLDTVDLNKLILRQTVIIDVPKREEEIIQPDELEEAFNKAPVRKGDALLVRTGWGDDQRYLKMGHSYRENSPHYNAASANKLMDLLEMNGSDLWLYDNCDMAGVDKKTGIRGGFTIRSGRMGVGGVVNCGAITRPRVKLIILPLKAKGGHIAPCSVVALED